MEFEALDRRLAKQPYLLGDALSALDIAWFIYGDDTKRNMPRRSELVDQQRFWSAVDRQRCAAGLGDPLARNPVLVAMLFGLLIGNQPCIA